jgi:hypothetical protein
MLRGARESFLRPDAPVLQVEFTDAASIAAGSSCRALYHLLQELGYKMFIYDGLSRTIVPAPLRSAYPYVNLIATKSADDIAVRLGQ